MSQVPETTAKPASSSEINLRPDFKGDASPLEILRHLVNNPYMADVVFKVGQPGTLMYAHKLIITMASEVFFAQLNVDGHFKEAQQDSHAKPLVIEDIEPSTMQEVLSYIYCSKVALTEGNMLHVYYAAKKYLLRSLEALCKDTLGRKLNDDNVLQIFVDNCHYNFEDVKVLCLDLICDNPLKIFRNPGFKDLDEDVLKIIVEQKGMNCHVNQLEHALAEWQRWNGKTNLSVELRVPVCRKLNIFGTPRYGGALSIDRVISVQSRIALYGVGIFVGVEYGTFVPDCCVSIEVQINKVSMASTVVNLSKDLITCELMFEKVIVETSCTMQVILGPSKNLSMFHLAPYYLADVLGNSNLMINYSNSPRETRIAYLLCQAEEKSS